MKQIRKKHKFSLPITITVCIALAIVFYLSLSYFLEGYRRDIYDRIINSNISALKETTSTLISKTTEGFDHCRHEIRVLGIGMSEELKENGFDSIDGLSNGDRSYLRDFNKVSVFDYCVLLNESGRLFVYISSSVARNEVFMLRAVLKEEINRLSGLEVISTIIVK